MSADEELLIVKIVKIGGPDNNTDDQRTAFRDGYMHTWNHLLDRNVLSYFSSHLVFFRSRLIYTTIFLRYKIKYTIMLLIST